MIQKIILCVMLCVISGCATYSPTLSAGHGASRDSIQAVVKWTPPADGAPVVYYVMEWAHGQNDTVTSNKVRVVVLDVRTRVRVAGVDSLSRQGQWSIWSLWWPVGPQENLHNDPVYP